MMSNKPKKLCLVCSSGGHLIKSYMLKPWWSQYDRFWVTRNDRLSQDLLKNETVFFGNFPENRNIVNLFKNLSLAFKFFKKEKPDLVFSLGAGIGPPFIWMAKLMGIKTVFMETFIFIPKPTLSGKLTYHVADDFLVQNRKLLKIYPNAKFWGTVL